MDRFLERFADDYPFMLAFDGALMMAEGRHADADIRFRECQIAIDKDDSSDSKYIRLFCHFIQSLATDPEWQKARQEALSLEVDPLVNAFLNFPSEERMSEIIREAGRPVVFSDTKISF